MGSFTPTQGRYLSFIHAYAKRRGIAPSEAEMAVALCVSPPAINQMVLALERKGLISRQPGIARSVRVLVPEAEVPPWGGRRAGGEKRVRPGSAADRLQAAARASTATNLYVLRVFCVSGPTPPGFAGKEISRVIEIRGDQTLDQLHRAIFKAYDRWDRHGYEFQLGRRPFDPKGQNYSVPTSRQNRSGHADARKITLDELGLKVDRCFGYWFDFGDDWYHQVHVAKIDKAIPTVAYPRVTGRVGKSPPQYVEAD